MLPDKATEPTPLLIEAEAALVDVHVRVALVPAVIVAGEAVNVAVGGDEVCFAAELPHPLDRPVAKPKTRISSNRPEV